MSLIWQSVSIILIFEIGMLLVLCAPLPWGVRKNISRWISHAKACDRIDMAFKYILFGLLLAFLESVSSLRHAYNKVRISTASATTELGTTVMHNIHESRWLQARAERNLYLAGFAISVMVAIMRLVRLAKIEVRLRDKIKQYNGNKPISQYGETIVSSNSKNN